MLLNRFEDTRRQMTQVIVPRVSQQPTSLPTGQSRRFLRGRYPWWPESVTGVDRASTI